MTGRWRRAIVSKRLGLKTVRFPNFATRPLDFAYPGVNHVLRLWILRNYFNRDMDATRPRQNRVNTAYLNKPEDISRISHASGNFETSPAYLSWRAIIKRFRPNTAMDQCWKRSGVATM
jgi:hypothetical protein